MKAVAHIAAPLALLATVLPPLLFAFRMMGEDLMKTILLIATFAWFVAAPFWLRGGER